MSTTFNSLNRVSVISIEQDDGFGNSLMPHNENAMDCACYFLYGDLDNDSTTQNALGKDMVDPSEQLDGLVSALEEIFGFDNVTVLNSVEDLDAFVASQSRPTLH